MFGWNANQYQKFEAQRTLPAMDLARAIPLSMVKSCLDVGCGIGNSTAVLQQQFPEAQILGVDSSENMLQTAKMSIRKQNISCWMPERNCLA